MLPCLFLAADNSEHTCSSWLVCCQRVCCRPASVAVGWLPQQPMGMLRLRVFCCCVHVGQAEVIAMLAAAARCLSFVLGAALQFCSGQKRQRCAGSPCWHCGRFEGYPMKGSDTFPHCPKMAKPAGGFVWSCVHVQCNTVPCTASHSGQHRARSVAVLCILPNAGWHHHARLAATL